MRGITMKEKIEEIIGIAERALEESDSYPFLPEIIESLENMKKNLNVIRERRERIAGALGRIITEDYKFSKSILGDRLLQIANEFIEYDE